MELKEWKDGEKSEPEGGKDGPERRADRLLLRRNAGRRPPLGSAPKRSRDAESPHTPERTWT
jgi:hypothetical protein